MRRDQEEIARNFLKLAYMMALQMPHGAVRSRHQQVLSTLRESIVMETGVDSQQVQDTFESLVLQMRLAGAVGTAA